MTTPLKRARVILIVTAVILLISAINMVALGFGTLHVIIFLATIFVFYNNLVQYRAARKEDKDSDE